MSAVAAVAVGVLAAGGVLSALPRGLRSGLAVQAAGVALLGAAGAAALFSGSADGGGFRDGASPALAIDGLSGLFLALLALTAVPTLVYARGYLHSRAQGPLLATFLLALAGVLTARGAIMFLAFWELMTLVPAAAILVARRDAPVRAAVQAYIAITHLGGAGVWLALLALALPGALAGTAQTLVAIAALIGFGTKAGLVPLHSWLPRAHPVAPAPFSALMSAMMVTVALYGLIRVEFEWLGTPARWLGFVLVGAGLVSALSGVVWALLQSDLKRLLAFSTIENVGLVVVALGASVLLEDPVWAAFAFAAALLHAVNHAVFKALLFLGAGAIERAAGTLDLDRLGGLARRLPWTGAAFAVGCLAIAGLPPLNGFTSEWLTLQALAHLAFGPPAAAGLTGAAALAAVAATAALALLCFAKVAGLVLLGPPRTPEAAQATEVPRELRAALLVLSALCVALGLTPGLLLPAFAGLAPGDLSFASSSPALDLPGTGSLPTWTLATVLIGATALLVRARGTRRAAPAPTWACGQPLSPALYWTSAAFTQPLRLVLQTLRRPRHEIDVVQPAIRAALGGAAAARRLQTGNVRTYAAYLLGLVLALLALARAGALG